MNPVTHGLSGWVLGSALQLDRRDRALVTLAALSPDLDGAGLVVDLLRGDFALRRDYWEAWHHVLAHNLTFAVAVTGIALLLAHRRWLTGLLVFAVVHLHLLEDLVGSRGPDGYQWPIPYLAPFDRSLQLTWSGQWALNGWPNIALTLLLMVITGYLVWRQGWSFFAYFWRRGDEVLVKTLRGRFGEPSER
ncbi:MAG: metal-dependent hydrolase [Deltaproteobacteria bacterium]|nr:metal-dependent hydrolase [Deltaproteobacteria bacterium]